MPRKSRKAKSSTKKNRSDAKVLTTQDAAEKGMANDGDGPTSVQDGRKIFALIIGINDYGHDGQYNLQGAKDDADRFDRFLREKFKTPRTNIRNLRDKKATRSSIIDEFKNLQNNKNIVANDATIIVYYAGHGAVADKPEDWDWPALDNKLEILCPADMSFSDSSENRVEGIPDRTISRLLLDISAVKGDNIILILDCCHSAGLTRNVNSAMQRPRRISSRDCRIPIKISPDCDLDIYSQAIRSGEATTKTGFSGSLWYSHVLLAACGRRESAMEEYKEGVFTRALLKVLREENNLRELTYQSLMGRIVGVLKDAGQTPHWDGKHTLRRIFGPPEEAADSLRVVCDCHTPKKRGRNCLRLMSGSLHGTTKGSEFEIYRTDLASDIEPLATASVEEVEDAFVSYLTISPPNEHIFARDGNDHLWYARLKAANTKFAVYCNDSEFLTRIQADSTCTTKLIVTVDCVSTLDEASLFLKVEENTVSFEGQGGERKLLRGLAKDFPWQIYHAVGVDNITAIRQIINHYARFTYHLTRRNVDLQITDLVSIEMRELGSLTPVGPNMLQQLSSGGGVEPVQVDVVPDKELKYEFSVRNISKEINNLYVYLLCFEASELAIDLWFSSPMASSDNGKGGPLGKDSPLHLGFSGPDMKPVGFSVPDKGVDVTFFQFFVATEPVNIRSLLQPAIEQCVQARKAVQHDSPSAPPPRKWASMTIPVIQNAV